MSDVQTINDDNSNSVPPATVVQPDDVPVIPPVPTVQQNASSNKSTDPDEIMLNVLSYDSWPLDQLLSRENELTLNVAKEGLLIDKLESENVEFLLNQSKIYSRTASILSMLSKIIGGICPIVLVVVTALSVTSFVNYIIGGIVAAAPPLYHFSEQMTKSANDYERKAMVAYNNDMIDLTKIKATRKKKQDEEAQLQSTQSQPSNARTVVFRTKKSKKI